MAEEQYKAYVGNLPYDALASDVETLLEYAGFDQEVIRKFEIHMVHDREEGRFKGFAYVTFETEEQLSKSINDLHGKDFDGRVLKVNRATQRDRGNRGGGGGGRGGGRGHHHGGNGGGHHHHHGGNGGGHHHGGNGGGRGGFRGGHGGGGGGQRNRHRKSQSDDNHHEERRKSENGDGAPATTAPAAERPRLNLLPRTTDPAELEARKAREEKEAAERMAKIFG